MRVRSKLARPRSIAERPGGHGVATQVAWRHLSGAVFWLATADPAASASVSSETAGIAGLASSCDCLRTKFSHHARRNSAVLTRGRCTPMLRHAMSGSADWVLLYPWKTFSENIYFFIVHSNDTYHGTQPHRIARQYFRRPEFVDNINHICRTGIQIEFPTKFLTTLWPFEISKIYFANSLPSILKIKHCRPVLKFWKRIHNT